MDEEKYMRRCIQLAKNGLCNTPPNPMVGAVIVCDGKIIGEGYHVRCGEGHAEVNAIRSVKRPEWLAHSTIYVSLEPCSHYGKTPPCADLIVEKGIPRIVVGCQDPFERVAGRGIQRLRDAGREVKVGVLEQECRQLIERFVTFHTQERPYITLKWAQSADGYLDLLRTGGSPARLSSPLTSLLTHKRRAEHKAILVGRHTAELDNPRLDTRHWTGPAPVRVVLDRDLRLPEELHLMDGNQPTLVFTARERAARHNLEYVTLDYSCDILPQLLRELHRRGLQSLLVEGGHELLEAFIAGDLWDEAWVETAPIRLGGGVPAPPLPKGSSSGTEIIFGHRYDHFRR